ncbi:MAG: hypothetical protein ACKV22_37730 [Bryobacteraceae bacterium]
MLQQVLVIFLVTTLAAQGTVAAASNKQEIRPATKEQLLDIPTGSIVEIRTHGKDKIRGRLAETSDQGFNVQTIQSGKLTSVPLAYDDVKSVKVAAAKESPGRKAGRTVGWIVVGGLAGLGVLSLVAAALYAGD